MNLTQIPHQGWPGDLNPFLVKSPLQIHLQSQGKKAGDNMPDGCIMVYNYRQHHLGKDADCYYNSGIEFAEKGHIDEAIKAYRKPMRINPQHEKASHDLRYVLGEGAEIRKQIDRHTERIRAWRDDKYGNR